jgi:hypothetical protein
MRLMLTLIAFAATAAAQDGAVPAIDKESLAPIFGQSWTTGESCSGDLVDFVIDTDGAPYARSADGFTPLTAVTFTNGELTIVDEVGISRNTTIYKLDAGKGLRLWSQVFDPSFGTGAAGPDHDAPEQRVKDGLLLIDDEGKPLSPGTPTPVMKPCPARTSFYPPEIVSALDGAWAMGDGKGGICPIGASSVTFDLKRPVPRIQRGPYGAEETSSSYALSIRREGEAYVVTDGSLFEASDYTYTPDGKGGLAQVLDGEDTSLALDRCP